jgi:hypothetical protein
VESSGVKDRLLKKWHVTLDGRERQAHADMVNKPAIPIDDFFDVGGEKLKYPGDPRGSAGNVIQCRCAIVYQRID